MDADKRRSIKHLRDLCPSAFICGSLSFRVSSTGRRWTEEKKLPINGSNASAICVHPLFPPFRPPSTLFLAAGEDLHLDRKAVFSSFPVADLEYDFVRTELIRRGLPEEPGASQR